MKLISTLPHSLNDTTVHSRMIFLSMAGYMLPITVDGHLLLNVVSTPAKGEVILHLTSLSFRTCPKMSYEETLYSLQPPSETGVLLLLRTFLWSLSKSVNRASSVQTIEHGLQYRKTFKRHLQWSLYLGVVMAGYLNIHLLVFLMNMQ